MGEQSVSGSASFSRALLDAFGWSASPGCHALSSVVNPDLATLRANACALRTGALCARLVLI